MKRPARPLAHASAAAMAAILLATTLGGCAASTAPQPLTTEADGLLQVGPAPASEPEWTATVADIGCGLSLQPWSGLYPFGGPVEQR